MPRLAAAALVLLLGGLFLSGLNRENLTAPAVGSLQNPSAISAFADIEARTQDLERDLALVEADLALSWAGETYWDAPLLLPSEGDG